MKKWLLLLTILVTINFIVFFYKSAMTSVKGECSNCHTMHASQNGNLTTPFPALIKQAMSTGAGCLACHSSTDAATLYKLGDSTFPIIYNTVPYSNATAAGNFYDVTQNDTYGHNVYGIVRPDSLIGLTPPGFKSISGWGPTDWNSQLTCAGTYGCHGIRKNEAPYNNGTDPWGASFAAIRGLHHATDRPYRMLYGDINYPIKGKEHPEYEHPQSTIPGQNVYYGSGSTTATDRQTISYFCATCHGKFHDRGYNNATNSGIGSSSPWLRHPTDIYLNGTWSGFYTDYGLSNNTYNKETPVAFYDLTLYNATTPITTFSNSTAIVMCLSCHRAHASPYPDILRFDYTAIKSGMGINTGCNRCHTRQR